MLKDRSKNHTKKQSPYSSERVGIKSRMKCNEISGAPFTQNLALSSTSFLDASSVPVTTGATQTIASNYYGNGKFMPGFIFLCNGRTKPECYHYRVFGLPADKIETIKKIKPGSKLFLFDFELKLLYGTYEATCTGGLNLEPAAFHGKFPAQVQFKILLDSLPLSESIFRHAIQHNYKNDKSKFHQELSEEQVKNLLTLFQPIPVPVATHVTLPQVPILDPSYSVQDKFMQEKLSLHSAAPICSQSVSILPFHTSQSSNDTYVGEQSVPFIKPYRKYSDFPADPYFSAKLSRQHIDDSLFVPQVSLALPASNSFAAVSAQATGICAPTFVTNDPLNGRFKSGFIFMCSGRTKHDCYRYRVFGLPANKLETVQKIGPGSKLFLFDFELKLLYGTYEATSTGGLDLEPAAFGGKFPAQVQFKIVMDCSPVPERALRYALPESYQSGTSKFRQELNEEEVKRLVNFFQPIPVPGSINGTIPSHPIVDSPHSVRDMQGKFFPSTIQCYKRSL